MVGVSTGASLYCLFEVLARHGLLDGIGFQLATGRGVLRLVWRRPWVMTAGWLVSGGVLALWLIATWLRRSRIRSP